MALSMDEQRVLAEIERRLAAEDPGLAACLTAFRRPGPATVFRSPRARIIGSLFTVLLVALVSLMVYAMIPFRGHGQRPAVSSTVASPISTASARATGSQPPGTPAQSIPPSASTGMKAADPATPSASSPGTSGGRGSSAKTAGQSAASGPLPAAYQDSRHSWTRYRSSPSSFLFSCWNSSLSGLRCWSNSSA
jgi:hypothetical protein